MKRTRSEMKAQARTVLRRNYWKIVLVSLIALLLTGGGSAGGAAGGNLLTSDNSYTEDFEYYYSDGATGDSYASPAFRETACCYDESVNYFNHGILNGVLGLTDRAGYGTLDDMMELLQTSVFWVALLAVLLVIFAVVIVVDVFVLAPLRVGTRRFFLVSQQEKARLGELSWAFDQNYGHTVKTMLLRDVKLLLWTLLLIIPGIVKTYEYRAVPYLLAECPEMTSREIFTASRELMRGNKWRAFVLDLSFLLWNIGSLFTLGLLGIFYVNPYQNLTDAVFYQTICQEKAEEQNRTAWMEG